MKIINGNSLEQLWNNVVEECKKSNEKVSENVILNGEFEIKEIESDFIKLHTDKAKEWQNNERPKELIINHGEYINKGNKQSAEKGINYILDKLNNNNYSNRSCYSLINMEDIVDSRDDIIPSFMILQFSFSNENANTLLVSAYFRALEVQNFLPINLAEICINIKSIKSKFPRIKNFELNVFIFRAQYIENFYCLRHSKLDSLGLIEIYQSLIGDKEVIINALKDKKNIIESVITDTGIKNLKEAISSIKKEDELKDMESIKVTIDDIIEIMAQIKDMRKSTSIQNNIEEDTSNLKCEFEKLIVSLESNKK
jgi:hypothetical protein